MTAGRHTGAPVPDESAVFVDPRRTRRVRALMLLGAASALAFVALAGLGLRGSGPLAGTLVLGPIQSGLEEIGRLGAGGASTTASAESASPTAGAPDAPGPTPVPSSSTRAVSGADVSSPGAVAATSARPVTSPSTSRTPTTVPPTTAPSPTPSPTKAKPSQAATPSPPRATPSKGNASQTRGPKG